MQIHSHGRTCCHRWAQMKWCYFSQAARSRANASWNINNYSKKDSPCKHSSKQGNLITAVRRGNIVSKDQSCPQTVRLSVAGSGELDVNWRALVSNKTAKPGWYGAYCRSHAVWGRPVWEPVRLSVPASVCVSPSEPDIYQSLLWNQQKKVGQHLQPWQGSKGKRMTSLECGQNGFDQAPLHVCLM